MKTFGIDVNKTYMSGGLERRHKEAKDANKGS